MISGRSRIPEVDSLRAFAALSIVLYHVVLFAGAVQHVSVSIVGAQLFSGLALFFVISGFVLYRPWAAAHLSGRPGPDLARYALRRFLRIVPAYWVALTITGIVLAPEVFQKPLVFYGFGQTYSLETNTQGVAVAYTLCLEVAFYVALPFYASAIGGLTRRIGAARAEGAGLVALLLTGLVWKSLGDLAHIHLMQLNTLGSVLAWFAAGMGLAVISARHAIRPVRVAEFVGATPALWWALALLVLAFEAFVLHRRLLSGVRYGGAGNLLSYVADGVFATLVMLPVVFPGDGAGRGRRLLGSAPAIWLGVVSYGIYLWQGLGFKALTELGLREDVFHPTVWWVPLGLGTAVALGAASWYAIERPALRLGRGRGRLAVSAPVPGAPPAPSAQR